MEPYGALRNVIYVSKPAHVCQVSSHLFRFSVTAFPVLPYYDLLTKLIEFRASRRIPRSLTSIVTTDLIEGFCLTKRSNVFDISFSFHAPLFFP